MGTEEVIAGKRMDSVACPMEILQEGLHWTKGICYCTCCPADGAITLHCTISLSSANNIGKLCGEIRPQNKTGTLPSCSLCPPSPSTSFLPLLIKYGCNNVECVCCIHVSVLKSKEPASLTCGKHYSESVWFSE